MSFLAAPAGRSAAPVGLATGSETPAKPELAGELCQVARHPTASLSSPTLISPGPSQRTTSAQETAMSLHIYIAHTGEHLLADPVSFASYVFFPVR